VHGYHAGADDAAIYVPGIKQVADPDLYPFGAEFFQSHARLTIFPLLVGGSARLAHLPTDWVIFGVHIAGMFLLMLASWRLVSVCFDTGAARWGGLLLLAAVLTIPVAGTALAIADPYVTARSLATPLTILSVASFLSGHRWQAGMWWAFTALIHPQMSAYAAVFLVCLAATERVSQACTVKSPAMVCFAAIPFLFELSPASGPAREALISRTYFFVSQWTWYEWAGVAAPLALLASFSLAQFRAARPASWVLARALTPFGLMFTLFALTLTASPRLENYARLQPMRALHLIYLVFFLLFGGLLGEYLLRTRIWRWLALFVPLAVGMYLVQRAAYPSSNHVDWPGAAPANPWSAAFLWIRANTPKTAVFALDPGYMSLPGEDMHGFRALAERSMLADAVKDSGAVSLFPGLAEEWKAQVQSVQAWSRFQLADFEKLAAKYPVTWFVMQAPGAEGMDCPYRNRAVAVCRLPSAREHRSLK